MHNRARSNPDMAARRYDAVPARVLGPIQGRVRLRIKRDRQGVDQAFEIGRHVTPIHQIGQAIGIDTHPVRAPLMQLGYTMSKTSYSRRVGSPRPQNTISCYCGSPTAAST